MATTTAQLTTSYSTLAAIPSAEFVRVRGTVTGGALAGLRLVTKLSSSGTGRTYLNDADFDSPNAAMPYTSKTDAGASLFLTAGGSVFEFCVDTRAFHSVTLEGKSASTSTVFVEVAT